MTEFLLIFIGAVLANNFVLVKFLGLCPFFGASARIETAVGMSLATTFVLTLASGMSVLLDTHLLRPYGLEHLRVLGFIMLIAATVQFAESVMRDVSPVLYRLLGIFLPLITTNCAVLGITLLIALEQRSFFESVWQGFATAIGFSVVLLLFSAMRVRLEGADVPAPFRGAPIALVTAGLMALAFMGFAGLEGVR